MKGAFTVLWDEEAGSHMVEGNLDEALRSLPTERFSVHAMRSGQFGLWAIAVTDVSHGVTSRVTGVDEDFETALRKAIGEFMASRGLP